MKGKKDEQRYFALSFHVRNNEVSFSLKKKKRKITINITKAKNHEYAL